MNDRVRPCDREVATRGVIWEGKGYALWLKLDVIVIVDGVRMAVAVAVTVGEGGKTKRVWDGVADTGSLGGVVLVGKAIWLVSPWSLSGGGACFRERSLRRGRGDSRLSWTAIGVIGEGGTGGRIPRGGGRRLAFPGATLNDTFVGGNRGALNESFVGGAVGGDEKCLRGRDGRAAGGFDSRVN